MVHRLLFTCGGCIVGAATLLYILTWLLMATQPSRVLLGGVEGIWLKFLIRAGYVGLLILVLGAVDAATADLLFGRR